MLLSALLWNLWDHSLTLQSILVSAQAYENTTIRLPRRVYLKVRELIFFLAIYLIPIGTGGHKPFLESFGADQFDDENPKERGKRCPFSTGQTLGYAVDYYLV
ncbi:hypothetical protein FXO38_03625 [Capsicum annuum]|nr:hypothetical protein FXO37_21161 [Capsicum annuum]KAF3677747.1 hypothetical protein FXO38_03625 [Capsicum annuum]